MFPIVITLRRVYCLDLDLVRFGQKDFTVCSNLDAFSNSFFRFASNSSLPIFIQRHERAIRKVIVCAKKTVSSDRYWSQSFSRTPNMDPDICPSNYTKVYWVSLLKSRVIPYAEKFDLKLSVERTFALRGKLLQKVTWASKSHKSSGSHRKS